MRRPATIAPPNGKLGVLTVGMGAVATTFMGGVDLVRRNKAHPVGALTQLGSIRLGKRTEKGSPLIRDFVPLDKLENIAFGGWDIFPDSAYEAAAHAKVLGPEHLAEIKKTLSGVRPMKAAFDQTYVKNLSGTNVKKAKTKYDPAIQLRADIANFQKKHRVSRTVVIWCGSTEHFHEAARGTRHTREVCRRDERKSSRHRAFDALCLGRDHQRCAVRERRTEPDRRRARAHRNWHANIKCPFAGRTSRPGKR